MMPLKYFKTRPEAYSPVKAYASDAGFDVKSTEDKTLEPGETYRFKLGLKFDVPDGHYLLCMPKSGMSESGISVLANVVDGGYSGEVSAVLHNAGNESRDFKAGDKLCQFVLSPVPHYFVAETFDDFKKERGSAGFGSTGKD